MPSPPASLGLQAAKIGLALVALVIGGFFVWSQLKPQSGYRFDSKTLTFNDQAKTNVPLDASDISSLPFVDMEGNPADLKQYAGKNNVVVVVTRGNTSGNGEGAYHGHICLYCATQTSRLVANYQAFRDCDAEVVVVFPIQKLADRDALKQFREAVRKEGASGEPPFPLVLDVDLRAVDQLGIRADLSRPATYIVDKHGQVRFAYVGATIADRPSVKAMLDQLATINADAR